MSEITIGPRGCGESRTAGGIYAETGLAIDGTPLEEFIIDPPVVVDVDALGVTPVGTKLIQDPTTGTWHILDWVGSEHYPNVADYIEEVRRMGLSRRLSPKLDYALLGRESRILLIHARAMIVNHDDYYQVLDLGWAMGHDPGWRCPKDQAKHQPSDEPTVPGQMCAGLWWQDVEGGIPIRNGHRPVQRRIPAGIYDAFARPDGILPRYQPALFMALPIGNIAVVQDPAAGTHTDALETVSAAELPISLEDA